MKSFEEKLTFGKYKGKTVCEVLDKDRKYLEWYLFNTDIKISKIRDSYRDLKQYLKDNQVVYLNDSVNDYYNCKSCHSILYKQPHGSYAYCLNCYDKFNAKDDKKKVKKEFSKTEFLD